MEDLIKNAQFQLANVDGWMSAGAYEAALIKAKCLVEALEAIVNQPEEGAK